MGEKTNILAIYLDAPLQSWGYQSRFDRRTTLSYPTRSGVIGLICAAMGIDRENVAALEAFSDLALEVYGFQQEGRLIDFHTVGGGYDRRTQKQHIVRTADGKSSKTVVTYREYLQCAKFGVILSGPGEILDRIEKALINPRWGVWLGRKCCIPAMPLFQGRYSNKNKAIAFLAEIAGSEPIRVVTEAAGFSEGTDTIMDNPHNFSKREFLPRRINDEPFGG